MSEKQVIRTIIKYVKSNPSLWIHFNDHYKTHKYDLQFLLSNIFYILRTGLPWRELSYKNL